MLAFLGLTLVVLTATLGLARWSFERGFLDYVNALEQTRLEMVSRRVAKLYVANNQDWRSISPQRLNRELLPFDGPNSLPPPPPFGRPRDGEGLPPHLSQSPVPPPQGEFDKKQRDPKKSDVESLEVKPSQIPRSLRAERGPRRPNSPGGIGPLTALFNMQNERIAGRAFTSGDVEIMEVPVIVDGQTIALLRSEPKRDFDSPIETAFSRQQWLTSGVIGIASLLLAALVSWGLTQLLVAPVRRIIRGVRELSAGDYSQRLVGGKDEYGRLIQDINHLSNTLEKNQSSRRRWIADISHELRTPLSILTGEIEALKDGVRPFNRAQLESLDQEVVRLRHLTDDLYQLSLSDIGGLRYEFTAVDLAETVQDTVSAYHNAALKNDINLSFKASPSVLINADQQRLSQLMTNVLRNSLAYTNAGGVITLSLEQEADTAILKIHDTPPGVTQEECDQLFEPLYRQDSSRNRRSAGAGLGLAICRNIVEAHRGKITAAPSPLGGLEITITLPILE